MSYCCNAYIVPINSATILRRQAAAILAKSGLGKAELARLWAVSDADRDGALSRVEFSIAMHLAACSANKGLPVPSALPSILAALLPKGSNREQRAPAVEDSKKLTGDNPYQNQEESSAHSPDEEHSGSGHPHRSIDAGGKDAGKAGRKGAGRAAEINSSLTARNKSGVQAAGKGRVGGRNEKSGGKREAGTVGQKKELERAKSGTENTMGKRADTAEKKKNVSKKRGFGIFASSSGRTDAKNPTADNESTPAAFDRGGKKKKKRPKNEDVRNGREKLQKREEVAAINGKRKSSSGKKQREASKLVTASTPTAEKGEVGIATTSAAADVGGGVGKVGAGSNATESITESKHERRGIGEDGSSIMEIQSVEVGDAEIEGRAGTQESNTAKKLTEREKYLSSEETDQLYAMTTSERAGYDVIFMQVPPTLPRS